MSIYVASHLLPPTLPSCGPVSNALSPLNALLDRDVSTVSISDRVEDVSGWHGDLWVYDLGNSNLLKLR